MAALTNYQGLHGIFDRLAQADPSNAEWQPDLALTYGRVGMVEAQEAERNAARVALQPVRDIIARLTQQSLDAFTLFDHLAWFDTLEATLDE